MREARSHIQLPPCPPPPPLNTYKIDHDVNQQERIL